MRDESVVQPDEIDAAHIAGVGPVRCFPSDFEPVFAGDQPDDHVHFFVGELVPTARGRKYAVPDGFAVQEDACLRRRGWRAVGDGTAIIAAGPRR